MYALLSFVFFHFTFFPLNVHIWKLKKVSPKISLPATCRAQLKLSSLFRNNNSIIEAMRRESLEVAQFLNRRQPKFGSSFKDAPEVSDEASRRNFQLIWLCVHAFLFFFRKVCSVRSWGKTRIVTIEGGPESKRERSHTKYIVITFY